MTPLFKTGAECNDCLTFRPLLLPVRIATPAGDYVVYLCLGCRLNWREGQYWSLATTLEHSVARQWAAGVGGGIPSRARGDVA